MARSLDRNDIRNRMLVKLRAAGFNSLSTGSVVRTLSDIWAEDISQIIEDIQFITSSATLSGATGGFLDLIGQLVGVVRLPSTAATIDSSDNSIKFYCTTGVLSDYLPDSSVTGFSEIPSNTKVYDATSQIVFLTSRTLVPKGVTEIYVSATAEETGSKTAVPAGTLTQNSLNNPNVKVTNITDVSTGNDLENDENFRYRISTAYTTLQAANESAVRIAALLTPGISDVQLYPNAFGPGTVDVMLVPEGNTVTQEQLNLARYNVGAASAFGMSIRVRTPDFLQINMVIHLTVEPGAVDSRKDQAVATARSQALAYIASVPIGGIFSPSVQESQIIRADSSILRAEVILFCVNGVPVGISDYQLAPTELFIPASTFTEPIEVVV